MSISNKEIEVGINNLPKVPKLMSAAKFVLTCQYHKELRSVSIPERPPPGHKYVPPPVI